MEGLPKLPGLDFDNRLKQHHTVSHCFDMVNGYRIPRKPPCGIGGDPLKEDSIEFVSQDNSALYDPVLTYGRVKRPPVEPFRPRYVVYDRIVLTFKAFFKQSIPESPKEHYRIRYVNIMYFMEDDTLTVYEPPVRDCGFPQGRLVRRGRVPKSTRMDYYTWKDLNIGIDLAINGHVYHVCDCDEFTKEFLAAQGIELNETEALPVDPYTSTKMIQSMRAQHRTPSDDDKLRRYLEFQGKVLTFDAVLDETDRPGGECMTYKVFYFLEDDTVAVKELKENQEGRDRFPMLVKRMRLPRNWRQQPNTFPAVFLEVSDAEVNEYYQPKDMRVGETLYIYGRRFLLLNCDPFTRKYFAEVLRQPQGDAREIRFPKVTKRERPIPEYVGLGTPEDSLQSCFGLVPKAPKKDVICYMMNMNKYLRFGAVLDNVHPEDSIRQFVIFLSLADGQMKINEPPIRNSGIKGGLFLKSTLVVRPGCDPKMPVYYGPKDFHIGAILTVHSHRFRIVSADLFVYRYMQEHPEMFAPEAIAGVRAYCLLSGNLSDDVRCALEQDFREYQKAQQEAEPPEPMTDMERCLKEVHLFEEKEEGERKMGDAEAVDLERKPGTVPDNECQYHVNTGDMEALAAERRALELQRQREAINPVYYVSGRCANDEASGGPPDCGKEKRSVRFEGDTKCVHNVPTGNCLTCCP